MKTIKDIDIEGKTILVRVDYNVPMKDGEILSDFRIRASLPTLEYLREQGAAKIILISHLGRPEGKDPKMSLEKIATYLDTLIGRVNFSSTVSGPEVKNALNHMKQGDILLLENLRFYPGEKGNDPDFIKDIIDSTNPDLYVQDGFAVVHRAHASTDAVKNFLPVYAGLLLEHEVDNLTKILTNPAKPFLFVLGGSKVEDKEPLIEKFAHLADQIVIGGKIAADGYKPTHQNIYVAEDFDEDSAKNKLDIGPISTSKLANFITDASTIVWNGLLGKAEDPAFSTASTITAELMGEKETATTIVCGGDTTGFVEELMENHPSLDYSLLSTGGGAALEFLLGNKMPGLEAITK